jgi:diguanylate cyclase
VTAPTIATALLGTDPHQRIRLLQTATASLLMFAAAVAVNYLMWVGITPVGPGVAWTVFTLGSFAGFLLFIRLGFNQGFADPSLSAAQMVLAMVISAWAYAIANAGRGAVFPAPMLTMMFGMYALKPESIRRIGWFAVFILGAVMAVMSQLKPAVYEPRVELVHFFVFSVMILTVSWLAGQLSRLRNRLRTQKTELAHALERIQDLATHDELTGLFNRRHMQDLLQLEHQRCMRSGHPFCIVMLDLDHFKRINDAHGHAGGDAVLRAFAAEARSSIRASDTIARWGGEEFLLLMTDTRASLGKLGVERLRERVSALRPQGVASSLPITVSAGLAEHRAGEPISETISRADQAVYLAKAQGRNRVVMG